MPEAYQNRSPLAHRGLAARAAADAGHDAGSVLSEPPPRAQVALRGDPADRRFVKAVAQVLDVAPPTAPNTVAGPRHLADGPRILWLGPDEWLVVAEADEGPDLPAALRAALGKVQAAVVEVTGGRAVIALAGPRAGDVLAKGTALDLHDRAFAAGRCAQTRLARANVIVHQTGDGPDYELYVARSFADYLWSWLLDAADEYGVRVEAT